MSQPRQNSIPVISVTPFYGGFNGQRCNHYFYNYVVGIPGVLLKSAYGGGSGGVGGWECTALVLKIQCLQCDTVLALLLRCLLEVRSNFIYARSDYILIVHYHEVISM